jgi:hypothetical protein
MLIALALSLALAGDPDTTKVTVDFENAPLSDILTNLTLISQVPIELDDAARKKVGDLSKQTLSMKLKDTSVTAAIKLIFQPRGLEVKVADNKKLMVTVP